MHIALLLNPWALTGPICRVAPGQNKQRTPDVAGGLTELGSDYTGDIFICLRNRFGALYAERDRNGLNAPKMLGVGMHCRLPGRPDRFVGLQRFLHHVAQHDKVWICKRIDIARFWKTIHPFIAGQSS